MLDCTLLPPAGPLLIAVSGGCDSMVLWALLDQTQQYQLTIYHLDHAIRPDSAEDANLIRAAPFAGLRVIERSDIPALAAQWKCGLEAAGRRQRYARMVEVARDCGATVVVTAHHRDDQIETVLLNLIRGSHGVVGMPAIRKLSEDIRLVRPLLQVSRTAVQAWAATHAVPWRADSTNTDTTFRRNHVRHVVVPALESVRPGITEQLLTVMRPAGGPDEDPIRTLARTLKLPVSKPALTRLRDLPSGGRTTLGGWLFTRSGSGELTWEPEKIPEAPPAVVISAPGVYQRGAQTLNLRLATNAELAAPRGLHLVSQVTWPLVWRSPLPAERWRPLGCPGRQLLMDSLAARKVPARCRSRTTVLADLEGPIWLAAVGMIADRVKVTAATTVAWRCTVSG